ncbi:MBL fold metallo-hydrolase [Gilvibacter sediminis]|uniref:MBL fold metallo-hydrolase n=1 Tax=Gilvibacter sediminis TaxID=379071 RepID=UPI0023505D6F|nr:MBL fold metallo-hydrolase [Gilvibacter sediminis]MDC7997968.1 MBL fold metallo-hydrolase [Gilvibacter sediminis]
MKKLALGLLLALAFVSCKNETKESAASETTAETPKVKELKIHPIGHATMVLEWGDTTIYVDPVGGVERFANYNRPDLILVTDVHGDHLNAETLAAVSTDKTKIILPQACADRLEESFTPQLDVLGNGESKVRYDIAIEAIPMYNLREEDKNKHVKGRGNGYVMEQDGRRVYISGDTEDIPEMRALENIEIAFVCMNLPYTMTVESAADAVVEFAPTHVYPYHYRGANGLSDVGKFKSLVDAAGKDINVIQLDWYGK